METFTVRDLSFSYPGQNKKTLDSLSFSLTSGEFAVLCGPSGCGKSTLLRHFKTVLAPHGIRSGEILFEGEELSTVDERRQSAAIGFVQQSPENQIVTDKVWHELAFGLEGLGFDTQTIRARVAEMASFFGIQNWFYRNVSELSGGQKQLLNLASVMVMGPSVLILDEPTSQLDPIAASDFLRTVERINRELGTTVIMTEHRLDEVIPMADRLLVMEKGRLIADAPPREAGELLKERGNAMFLAMPAAMRIWAGCGSFGQCPLTVREGRDWLKALKAERGLQPLPAERLRAHGVECVLELDDVWFRYTKNGDDAVKGLSLKLYKGEFLALLGGNGSGKSTSLSLAAALRKPVRGQVSCRTKAGLLPQDPQTFFVKKTVIEDLYEVFDGTSTPNDTRTAKVESAVDFCGLSDLLQHHPYDLSGGEQQRLALAKLLLTEPDILLLDEPTKGLDAEFKASLGAMLGRLTDQGVSILMVSHDVEFCAEYAHRCGMIFDGKLVSEGSPRSFFSGNSFYTTAADRMARSIADGAVTCRDLLAVCGGSADAYDCMSKDKERTVTTAVPAAEALLKARGMDDSLPVWRKMLAAVCGAVALWAFVRSVSVADLSALLNADGISGISADYVPIYISLIVSLFGLAFAVNKRKVVSGSQSGGNASDMSADQHRKDMNRKAGRRTVLGAAMILLLIPLTIWAGVCFFGGRKYYFIALLVLLEAMAPFALIFEKRKPQARELVLLAGLCAIGVAGRAIFFMLPNFKPVLALVIICGAALGPESGFLTGAMTMLVSNVLFGQGPWTPWQMFAMGMSGFLAGLFYRNGITGRKRLSLCIFGAICAVVIYGGIMNPAAALMWAGSLNKQILLSYYLSGFPIDLVHACATVLLLWFGAVPMTEKLERIRIKYGLEEDR